MQTFRLVKGTVILDNGVEKSLFGKLSDGRWQLQTGHTGEISVMTETEFGEKFQKKELSVIYGVTEKPEKIGFPTHNYRIPDKLMDEARRKYAYVKELMARGLTKGQKKHFGAPIAAVAMRLQDVKPPTVAAVYGWFARFLESGKDIMSLVNNYNKRGRIDYLHPMVKKLIEDAIDEIYMTPERRTKRDVLVRVIYMIDIDTSRGGHLKYPSQRTVDRRIELRKAKDVMLARYGPQRVRREFRSVTSPRQSGYPMERVEIDHTVLNVFVVDDVTFMPLGRATVTGAICENTSMPVGLFISFHAPSVYGVLGCMKSMLSFKQDVKKMHPEVDLEIENDWIAGGLPETLVLDNAMEFFSKDFLKVTDDLGISLEYTQGRTPWMKGSIERFMGEINASMLESSPGTTFNGVIARGDYDPKKHAVIRFSVLVKILHKWILDVYTREANSRRMARPIDLWNEGIKMAPPFYPKDPIDIVHIIGKYDNRRLDHEGITLFKLHYNNQAMTDLRMELGASIDVEIQYDDCDISFIFVVHPRTKVFIKVECVEMDYARGMNLWQHKIVQRHVRKQLKAKVDISSLARAKNAIWQLIREELLRKKTPNLLKIARLAGASSQTVVDGKSTSVMQFITGPLPSDIAPIANNDYDFNEGDDDDDFDFDIIERN